jgi:hypothetical protein
MASRHLAQERTRTVSNDPVADLRAGWDAHVELGIGRPALYFLLSGEHQPGSTSSPAAHAAQDVLAGVVHRIAESVHLKVPERRAAQQLQAAARGTTLTLIALPEDSDPELSRAAREAVVTAVTTPATTVGSAPVPADDLVTAAVTLRAPPPHVSSLTPPELAPLDDSLTRIERPSDACAVRN